MWRTSRFFSIALAGYDAREAVSLPAPEISLSGGGAGPALARARGVQPRYLGGLTPV